MARFKTDKCPPAFRDSWEITDSMSKFRKRMVNIKPLKLTDNEIISILIPSDMVDLCKRVYEEFDIRSAYPRGELSFEDDTKVLVVFTNELKLAIPKQSKIRVEDEITYEKIRAWVHRGKRIHDEWKQVQDTFAELNYICTTKDQLAFYWPCIRQFTNHVISEKTPKTLPRIDPELRVKCKTTMATVAKALLIDEGFKPERSSIEIEKFL